MQRSVDQARQSLKEGFGSYEWRTIAGTNRSDPGVVSNCPVSSSVFSPERIII